MAEPAAAAEITGLVLAGGRGQRMGGQDKGLLVWQGQPLVQQVLQRLAPQVGVLAVNANRHLEAYRALGVPVWPDPIAPGAEAPAYDGPLAGLLSGLRHAATPWLVTSPCDSPKLPPDLVRRLAEGAAEADVPVAIACTVEPNGRVQRHPVFCLLHREQAAPALMAWFDGGGRRLDGWLAQQAHAVVAFEDAAAFANLNTPQDWAQA